MLFRALFFIAAVALLAPHEPDLGYGAPRGLPAACDGATCTIDPGKLAAMKEEVLASLARVKADIAQAQAARAAHGG